MKLLSFSRKYFPIIIILLMSFFSRAKEEQQALRLSSHEQDIVRSNLETSYAYLGSELSDLIPLVNEITEVCDSDRGNGVRELQEHLHLGYKVGRLDTVVGVLNEVLPALEEDDRSEKLTQRVKKLIEKLQSNELSIRIASEENDDEDDDELDAIDSELQVQDMPVIADDEVVTRDPMIEKIEGCLEVTNDALIGRNLTVENDFLVKDDAEIRGKLEVCDKATFKKKVKFKRDVEFRKDVEIEGDLEVEGNVAIEGDLEVDGDTELKNTNVEGNLSVQEDLVVCGEALFKSNVDILDNLTVHDDLVVCGDTHLKGDVNIDGNVSIQENLVVCGDVTFKSNVDFLGDLTVENLTVIDDLVVCGDTHLKGDVDIDGNLSVQEDLVVCGDAEFKGSTVDVFCDLIVGCNIFMNDTNSPVGNIYKAGERFIHNFGTDNTFVGKGAGNFTMTGTMNSAFGARAFRANTTGTFNSALGLTVLDDNTTGSENTAMGQATLANNTTGNSNTAFGRAALLDNLTGGGNIAVGRFAIENNTTGNSNIGIGNSALAGIIAGSDLNIAIGHGAGGALTAGDNNLYIFNAGTAAESGQIRIGTLGTHTDCFVQGIHDNTTDPGSRQFVFVDSTGKLGAAASPTNLSVLDNLVVCGDAEFKGSVVDVLCDLYVGKNIFMNDTNSPVGNIYKDNVRFIHNFGTDNTFVGKGAGNFTMTGDSNSAFGVNALTSNDTGGGNTGLGFQALCSNVSGSFNTAVGRLALDANATGVANTGVGNLALGSFTAGSSNTALGHLAGSALVGGSFNIMLGSSAGTALTSGSGNIYIGNPGMAVETSQIRIGVAQTDCFIQGIHDNTVDPGSRQFVFVDSTGKLGAAASPTNLSVLDDLVVCGDALFKSNVDILEDLTVQDNVDIGCDLTVGCNILMNNSTSAAIGNINKGGVRFIHNFGIDNTFVGKGAGNFTLGVAIGNNGFGVNALSSLTTGDLNIAFGAEALRANTTGNSNMAIGTLALGDNTTGSDNVAVGTSAMIDNVTGIRNVAIGQGALLNSIASFNVGIGTSALNFMAGATDTGNIAIGYRAGWFLTSGSDNIYIANNGTATESGQIRIGSITSHTDCYIQGIFGATVDAGTGTTVSVDSDGKLGTVVSSKRFKTNINDMETASDGLMELRPVQFTYKNDANNGVHYGLIAEEVEQVYPELVVRDRAGESYSVRYHELPPMLLNELQKDRKTIQLLQNTIKDLVARIVVLEEKTKQ